MTTFERRLYVAGLALFLFGLVLGFAVPAFPDKRAVLNAHLTALGSGTFLIVIGVIWSKLTVTPKWSSALAHTLWISFYILQAGLTLDATKAAMPPDSPASSTHMIAGLLNAGGAVLMVIAVVAVFVFLIKSKAQND